MQLDTLRQIYRLLLKIVELLEWNGMDEEMIEMMDKECMVGGCFHKSCIYHGLLWVFPDVQVN